MTPMALFSILVSSGRLSYSHFRGIVKLDFEIDLLVLFCFIIHVVILFVAPGQIVSELFAVLLAEWATAICGAVDFDSIF